MHFSKNHSWMFHKFQKNSISRIYTIFKLEACIRLRVSSDPTFLFKIFKVLVLKIYPSDVVFEVLLSINIYYFLSMKVINTDLLNQKYQRIFQQRLSRSENKYNLMIYMFYYHLSLIENHVVRIYMKLWKKMLNFYQPIWNG